MFSVGIKYSTNDLIFDVIMWCAVLRYGNY